MARLDTAVALDTARVPYVQFAEIQTSRIAVVRWTAEYVCLAPGSLHVLLAKVLLVWIA
jgi:hypothetical protein